MDLLAAFMLGIAGSLHCIGMCGPIALALPRGEGGVVSLVGGRVLYQAGRISVYMLLGMLAGLGGSIVAIAGYERYVSVIAGSLMIMAVVVQLLWHTSILPVERLTKWTGPLRSRIMPMLRRNSPVAMIGLGALNGLLPCGLVTVALMGSIGAATPVDGAMFMAVFGLGTAPVMLALAVGMRLLPQWVRLKHRLVVPTVALVLGLVFVLRGSALGIPYLSPEAPSHAKTASCCSGH